MKALTVRQPWASLIAAGAKTIETRSWSTAYRGDLLIHAGKAPPHRAVIVGGWRCESWVMGPDRFWYVWHPASKDSLDLPLGAVVAVARLADVVPIVDLYGPDDFDDPTGVLWDEGDDLVFDYSDGNPPNPRSDGVTAWSVEKERPLGDFTPGRFAWLLDDVRPVAPVPAKGRQGLWTPDAALVAALEGDDTDG